MAINVPAHDVVGKKELGWIWATDKENARRAALEVPLPPLTPKQYLAQMEESTGKSYYRQKITEQAEAAKQGIINSNPDEDP